MQDKRRLPPEQAPTVANLSEESRAALPEEEISADPTDYSAIGGPENEPAYGRTRSLAGEYPFNEHGGPHDRDEPSHVERGGITTNRHIERRT